IGDVAVCRRLSLLLKSALQHIQQRSRSIETAAIHEPQSNDSSCLVHGCQTAVIHAVVANLHTLAALESVIQLTYCSRDRKRDVLGVSGSVRVDLGGKRII